MIRVGMVGLGKMGLSHAAIVRSHPDVELAAVCDSAGYLLDVLSKYTGVTTFRDFDEMMRKAELDAIVVSTPSRLHADMVMTALAAGLHVFCEKPFILDPSLGPGLIDLAKEKGLVNQVGYHCRFVAAFEEVKTLLDANAIGDVTHVLAESYGPVVLRPKGSTWRTRRSEGGGCLYDYAAHPINLLNWYFGRPVSVSGSTLNGIFSSETDDEVYSSLEFDNGTTAQLSVNWSDESCRKMTTKLTFWGTAGRIYVDRQEVQVYFRDTAKRPAGYEAGWNVRYTTDLTAASWYYLRGEEYSHQIDHFISCIRDQDSNNRNSFASALDTDSTIASIITDSSKRHRTEVGSATRSESPRPRLSWLARIRRFFQSQPVEN